MRVILVGKAGSGKDYYRDWLKFVEPLDVSYTTRPKRDGELPGYTYKYLSSVDFETLKNQGYFKEYVKFNGWFYGTSKDSWNTNKVFIMTPSGVSKLSTEDLQESVVIYFDINEQIRRKRLVERSDSDTVERRIKSDELDFKGFEAFNIRITNPNFKVEDLYTTVLSYMKVNK